MKIENILYPHVDARDDEVERLDGVELHNGIVVIDRVLYTPHWLSPPEYTTAMRHCGQRRPAERALKAFEEFEHIAFFVAAP